MKRVLLIILLFAGMGTVKAQILKPVKWTFNAKKIKTDMYEVHMTAGMQSGWKIYSQATPEGGPLATKVTFAKNPLVLLGGKVKEVGELHKKHEDVFDVDVHYYSEKVDFVQIVKVKKPVATELKGSVEFMACDAEQCLTLGEPFAVKLN